MKRVIVDIETDAVDATVIWCIVTREVDATKPRVWLAPFDDFIEYSKTVDEWVAHNGVGFDIPVMNRLLGLSIKTSQVIDTLIISRLTNFSGFSSHGLDELGRALGKRKTLFSDFSRLSQEMIDYCVDDVNLLLMIYKNQRRFIDDPKWAQSIRLEHNTAAICTDMQKNGFMFDVSKARFLLSVIKQRMIELEAGFQKEWPPTLKELKRVKYRVNVDGSLNAHTERALSSHPKADVVDGEVVCYDYKAFNPGSPADRVTKLWEANWKPTEKTKTHYKFLRQAAVGSSWGKTKLTQALYEEKKEHFAFYGWTVSEENLLTLPESAPEAARNLAEWLTLEGRRSSLVEWLGQVKKDGRIHGKYWHIGAWTHRMSHSSPNSANIASVFHGEPRNAVEEVKNEYDYQLRACWKVPDGSWLVGTDAEGIQLRILAHYLQNENYVNAIVTGRKENETDIHNVNKRALGLSHLERDDAKTFIYAHILGAGIEKTARILRTTTGIARTAVERFQKELGLDVLRKGRIRRDARRGYFDGLDGRKVICDSEHLMLAGYLQNGEAVIMKLANVLWRERADEAGLNYKQVNFVHDEWQTEVIGPKCDAELMGKIQRQAIVDAGEMLGVLCPLAGSTNIGKNWYDTH